ncbi:MAG: CRISPR-associated helicase Cas3' [Acidobacteriota bacterium]|nr:CRISPR-associated helicase Cas3' [Acidobacteriota bacterium]
MLTAEEIGAWPGKTINDALHPALWHLLDVGAVAKCLASRTPLTADPSLDDALVLLIALHDLGKFSANFREMLRGASPAGYRHWQHSYRLLRDHDEVVEALVGGTGGARRVLYAAVAGHHGGPPERLDARKARDQARQIGAEANEVAPKAIRAVGELLPKASLAGLDESEARRLSWLLSGLTVQADWIGSNTDWFGWRDAARPVPDYWRDALDRAEAAVSAAGLHRASPLPDGARNVLPPSRRPRPMQSAVADAALPDGPCLALIEDATGAGKTEAALILAARMMAAGKAKGFYFALPTMATSNAMLARLEEIVPRLFEGKPSLGLTHGRANLNELFLSIRGRDGSDPGVEVSCGPWLADDRRRILLADVGVGTIDQALLAVLPTRFNTLRLRALSGHVLIVDEAHEFDPYMETQLRRLLEFQARLGGSAIVMTATLPLEMRDGFTKAFQKGLGVRRPQGVEGSNYPALNLIGREVQGSSPDPVPATCRDVTVRRLPGEEEALHLLRQGAERGAACVWVRNAVDSAIAAVSALRTSGVEADLLHARFTVADRLRHERSLQSRFGRDGAGREGRVLVATQVVEASLDLDFDLMVSDLAPVGSLIQRAGRLWRHMDLRPADRRPVPGPTLHVLAPDPAAVEDAAWLKRVLGPGALVYDLDVQWRTAHALFERGLIRAPSGLRDLIEAIHGAEQQPVPPVLEPSEFKTQGREMVEIQQARMLVLDAYDEYDQMQMRRVFDDDRFPTRLGIPQVTLRLAKTVNGRIEPWTGDGTFGWRSSEVQVAAHKYGSLVGVDQDRPEIAALRENWPKWTRAFVYVTPVAEDGTICDGLRYDRERGAEFVG